MNSPPILEPILVRIGMFTGGTFDPWPCLFFHVRVVFLHLGVLSMGSSKDFCGRGCQHRFGIPFWLVGEVTTNFRTYFSWDWDVHWGYGLLTHGLVLFSMSVWSFSIWGPFHGQFQGFLWPWLPTPFWDPILVGR